MKVLLEELSDKGLSILAFPCNQFGKQEPGTHEEIKEFVHGKYECPEDLHLFSKIDVNGSNAHPIWNFLRSKQGDGEEITWNFAKFLVDKNGIPVKKYAPDVSPFEIRKDIEAIL